MLHCYTDRVSRFCLAAGAWGEHAWDPTEDDFEVPIEPQLRWATKAGMPELPDLNANRGRSNDLDMADLLGIMDLRLDDSAVGVCRKLIILPSLCSTPSYGTSLIGRGRLRDDSPSESPSCKWQRPHQDPFADVQHWDGLDPLSVFKPQNLVFMPTSSRALYYNTKADDAALSAQRNRAHTTSTNEFDYVHIAQQASGSSLLAATQPNLATVVWQYGRVTGPLAAQVHNRAPGPFALPSMFAKAEM